MKYAQAIANCLPVALLLTAGSLYTAAAFSDAKTNTTQQALEQLRILQKRMSPTTEPTGTNTQTMAPPQARPENNQVAANTPPSGEVKVPSASEKESIESMAFDGVTDQLFPLTR